MKRSQVRPLLGKEAIRKVSGAGGKGVDAGTGGMRVLRENPWRILRKFFPDPGLEKQDGGPDSQGHGEQAAAACRKGSDGQEGADAGELVALFSQHLDSAGDE